MRHTSMFRNSSLAIGAAILLMYAIDPAEAKGDKPVPAVKPAPSGAAGDLLVPEQWKALDSAVDRALDFLSQRQRPDGSFEAPGLGQPGITSLGVLAFLSRGHVPHQGPYGLQLDRAIDFALQSQQPNGVFFKETLAVDHQGTYNHAITGLMLGEVYGMTIAPQRDRIRTAIQKAIEFTREQQLRPKRDPRDRGGLRYVRPFSGSAIDADLSITAWHLAFLRSARNAEFEVPKEYIEEAMAYVRRTFVPEEGAFRYGLRQPETQVNRAMVGCGILALSLGGEHQTEMAQAAGKWVLKRPFDRYNRTEAEEERYHYSAYCCSQAMFQLGGTYWSEFYPPLLRTLVTNQRPNGSWDPESRYDGGYGNTYTTALIVLALTPPYQLLPIYQR